MINNKSTIRTLRTQAWERAKGELRSLYCTYYSALNYNQPDAFDKFEKLTENFITTVEDNALQE